MQTAGLKGSRLSLQQARLWRGQRESQVYRARCAVLLEGKLDRDTLQKALQYVVGRHEILRTIFHVVPGMEVPMQVVTAFTEVPCPTISLENLSEPDQAALLNEYFAVGQEEPFDLVHGPLLHAVLLCLAAHKHVLLLSLPALCADASTLTHLVAELSQAYTTCLQPGGMADDLLQYADVSAWQDELLQEEGAELHREYWGKVDLSQLATLRLPFERVLKEKVWQQGRVFAPERFEVPVDVALSMQIQALIQRVGVSVEAFLLTCWQVLLWRLTGEANCLVGIACDGRRYEELATALGLYTRLVPISTCFEKDQPFERVLSQVNASLQKAITEQTYFTWDQSSEAVGNNWQSPFFPISFTFESWPSHWTVGKLTFSLIQRACYQEPFALQLSALQMGQALQLELHFDPTYLSATAIERLAKSLHTLLHSIVDQPQVFVGVLSLLDSCERQRLLHTFSHTSADFPFQTLSHCFEAHVEGIPNQVAVVAGGEQLTYRQVNVRANQVAHALRRYGVGPNVLVGLCMERSVHMLVGLLAILKVGGAYVPLDPEHPPARLAYQLADVQAPLLLTQGRLLSRMPTREGHMLCLDDLQPWWADEPESNLEAVNGPEDMAYVIYTSGSTGVPKGVIIRHANVSNYTQSMCRLIAPEPGWHFATVSTLAADLGNTAIFCALASGGCLHILSYETVTSGQAFAAYVVQHPLDVLKIVPSHLSALLSASNSGEAPLPRRYLVLGGEALTVGLLRRLRESGARCCVLNHYGPTETTVGAVVNVLGVLGTKEEPKEAEEEGETVPIGRPIANTEAYVLDRYQQIVPVGVIGELYLGGAGLAAGYLQQEKQTQERFVPHPFRTQEGARLYKTGDLARYTEQGQIEFVGRMDGQVKLRGYRIELGEIEAVLRRHSNVRDCVVVLWREEAGTERLVAYMVARQQPAPTSQELRHFVGEQVPEYMVPSAFMFLRALPLTSNGKVDRRRLPVPELDESDSGSSDVGPRSPIEEILVEIWAEVLMIRQVGIHDNFFSLGGHSLLATQIIARVQSVLQVDLPILSLFEAPTVAGLAGRVERALRGEQRVEVPSLVPGSRTQDLPLSFAQQRLWFLDQLEPGRPTYNIPNAVRLCGRLDVAALEQSMQELVRRHESLRTSFDVKEDQPIQLIGAEGRVRLPVADLRGLPPTRREAQEQCLVQQEARRPFDLRHSPLWRSSLLRLGEEEHVLLLTLHHIVSDGWSSSVFVRELTALYNAFVQGQPSPLPELSVQYADFAAWQRQWLQGEALETQVRYWREQLNGVAPLELPTDYPRPGVQTFRGATQEITLPTSLSEELKQLSQREGVTLFMTLLAAFQVLLSRYSGQRDISVGTPIANRTRAELEGLIGFFVNTLVLRSDLSGNPSFQDLLKRVREVALGAYAHQDVPFEKLVEVLQPERDLSHSPFFQVMFILQNTPPIRTGLTRLTLQPVKEENTTAKFDLTLVVMESEQGLHCVMEYNTDLFEACTITRLLEHWQTLLTGIVAHAEQQIATLPLLTAEERYQLLHGQNDSGQGLSGELCLPQLLETQVARIPDAIALRYSEEQVSYEQLNERANILAHALIEHDIGPERLVAVLAERSVGFVSAILAIWKAGGVYLPLDLLHPAPRLAQVLKQSGCRLVLTTSDLRPTLLQVLETQNEGLSVDNAEVMLLETLLAQTPSHTNLPAHCQPGQLAYVIYTSGSTGAPKGVMVEHGGMLNHIFAKISDVQLTSADIVAQNGPQSFDISVWQCFAALLLGGSVEVFSNEMASDPARLLEQIEEKAITILQLVPSMLRALLDQLTGVKCPELRTLRWLIPTGDALPTDLCRQWLNLYPTIPVLNTYGSTECSDDQCHYAITAPLAGKNGLPIMPIGFPIANMRAYVLDEMLELVPIGVVGELYIGGPGVGRGYVNDPERTAEVFLPDPFSRQAGGRLYRTRDRVRYLTDGNIEFLGRIDHLVKVRGYRIELGEIEAVLSRHPQVRQSIVLAHKRESTGSTWLMAYVVPSQFPAPPVEELSSYLEGKLPSYMLPSRFVMVESLPLNSNGKVDRRALPVPKMGDVEHSEDVAAPRTPIEELVTGLWIEVLQLKQVGRHENFFELGGHSLLAARIMSRIHRVLRVEVPLRSLFEAPTVAGLAERVERVLHSEQGTEVPPLVPVGREQELPLSFAQQRLWFLDQLEPNSTAYNIPNAVRLRGKLDAATLERSLDEVVQRQESLRTTFRMKEGQPVQIIAPTGAFRLPVAELSNLPLERRENEARWLAQQEAQQPLNLAHGPLLRATLLRLSMEEHVLLLTMHHIVSDAWSMDVLVREVSTLYNTFVQGQLSPLPELPVQYADFAAWQRQWLQGEALDAQVRYWTRHLSELTPLELPIDHPRPTVQTFCGAHHGILLPTSLSEELKQLSQREGVTLFMTLLAAFQVLLSRYSGQRDISVGTPIANRTRAELEGLIGFFVNTLVLRSDLSGNPSFQDLLKRVREVALGAYAHQDVPFEKLVEVLQPERDLSRSPLFQVTFQLHYALGPAQRLQGLEISSLAYESGAAKFDLSLAMTDSGCGLHCSVAYNTDLFEASTISRFLEHFHNLLAAIVAQPERRLAELPLLSESQRQQLLVDWNETRADYPAELCLHTLFEAQVERTPEAIAVVFEDEHLTYRELNERANRLAHYLQQQGVGPEVLVGLCLERSPEMVLCLLAVLKAGGAYVPLDPTYPQERLAFMLADTRTPVLLTQHRLVANLPEHHAQVICLDTNWKVIDQQSRANLVSGVTSENAAYVIYTSGSTGKPKGVLIAHRAICNHMLWMQTSFPLVETDRVLQKTPFSFDASMWEFYAPLLIGAQLIMAQPGGHSDTGYVIETVIHYSITILQLVPSFLQVLLEHQEIKQCKSLKRVFCGGEELPVNLQKRFFTYLNADLYNLYGPTEATIDVTAWPCEPESTREKVPIGRPIANIQIYLLDAHLQPVPIGVLGELHIGGVGIARGYLNRPHITAEKFLPDPFSDEPGARLYTTGDLARYLPDGSIEYQERIDHQVKVRGFRIELGEVEAVLAQHPGLLQSVVVISEGATGDRQLVAYLVPRESSAPSSNELRKHLQEKLPDYMLPSHFSVLEALPLTPSGKVDRRALSILGVTRSEQSESTLVLSPIEEIMVELWKEILGLRSVGIHENFFELGGHSLLATQLITRVQAVLQVDVPLRSVFEAPTVAELAERVEVALRAGQKVEMPPLVLMVREGELPLSFAQQRLWFVDQLEPNSTAYTIANAVRLSGRLDAAVLEQSLGEIVRRHESLRTTFQIREGQPVQVIALARPFRLPMAELNGLPLERRETEAQQLAQQETRQPFDLAHSPLLRATLLRLSEDEHILLLSMHHIISDAWSMRVFVRELSTLYNAFVQGQPSPIPELTLQYADFAAWQRQWLQGEVLEAQVRYWTQQLGEAAPLELPTDYPRPATQTFRGARQSLWLPTLLSEGLKRLSQCEGVTLFMTLLAAFQVLLSQYSDQSDISVGTPIANRTRAELEGLIGFFVNTLVLRGDLSGNPSFRELLKRVREVCLGAYAHQDVPFEKLVEVLQPERDLSRPPLFQAAFQLQHALTPQRLYGLTTSSLPNESRTAKFELSLTMTESEQGLHCGVEYNTDLFEASTISRLLGHWQTLLAGIVAHPEQRLAELPLLSESERQQLFVDWNETQTDEPGEVCLHTLFEAQVERTPEAVALVFEDAQVTYREMNERANQVARHLQQQGVGPEVLVGLYLERSLEMVIGLLGVLKAGGAYVPLDPTYPRERLAFMLADAQVPILLTHQSALPTLPKHEAGVICLDSDWTTIAQQCKENPCSRVDVENAAYTIYTSGSTGRPKGVVVTHRGIGNLSHSQVRAFEVRAGSHVLQFASLSFDASLSEVAMTLPVGATLYLAPQFRLLPGLDLLSLLDEQAISVLTLPPSALAALPTEHNWSALETLIVAGEVCSAELAARWARRCRFFNAYGPTEATVCASMGAYADQQLQQQLNMGRPIANTQIYLLNEHLQAVPQGVKGEIYIAGVGLARGYLERAEVTAERFVPHPFSTISGARLYSTGDLARYRADGSLEFVGRVDQQVKVRGYRIELGEVETVLEQYPEVGESVVMVREDVSGDQRLVAYVVAQNGMSPLTNDLRQYLKERLPDYMLPSHFVVLEALPLLPTGKVDRRALPAPDTSQVEAGEEAAAAGSPIEDLLTMIWTEVLGRSMVSVHENFFESGGHSLLATQVISRVRTVMQVDLPVQRMFEAPTVAEFAQEIERSIRSEQGVEVPPLLPTSREQELPLSFAQQRLWFFDQLEPGSSAYNIPNTVRLSGQLDAAALERCLRELVRRHESLRTTFVSQAGRPVQVIGTAWRMELPVIDLQPLFQHKRLPEALRLAGEEALVPFDLSHGPLLRARLLRLGEDEHILLLSMHHIISDAWSMRVLVRELSTLYNAFVAGEILALPELPLQYADFAAWQRQWLQGEVLDAQMRYWTMQLNGLTPLELPTDHPRPAMQTFRGAHQSLLLPATLSTALKQLSQREGVTLFMTLLAAFQVLLSRYSGQSDIAVGTPIANRTLTELEDLIGFFVNTLVLRTDLSGNPSFLDLLKRVREVCLGAYAHQEVPFEKLVEVLQPERDLSRSPLFQAAFQLQHAPVARQALQGLTISSLPSQIRTAKFELTLAMTDSEPGLLCAVEYNADLFEASTISRLLGHWQTLLAGVVAHPEQHLAQLPLLSMAERQQLLADWNKTEVKYAEEECLHQLFEAQVVRTPEAAAVVCEDDYLTYGELNQRANQLAYYLRSLNIGPDVMVGICMERSLEMLVGILGTLKAGGAYVPLDPTHPQERLAFVLGDTQVSVLLTQETIVAKLPAHTAHVICLDADWELIAKESIFNPVSQNLLDDLAYVIYTSGSTGKPKGVLISHQNVVYSTRARFSYYSESVTSYLLLSPFTFDSSVAGIFWTLCQGGMLVLPEDNFQHDLSQLPTFIAQYGISHMLSIPSLYALVLSQAEQEQLCRLRTVIVAGEPCPVALVKRHSELLPHIALFNEYGPTEGAVWSSVYHCQIQEQRTQIPIGRPIANTQIYLLDANMQPVAVEMPGELYIGGIGLARGYLNQSQLTAEKFIPNTFRDKLGARLYRTGDLARYLSDGNIEFLGRVDQQVKLRGYRIELGEIEAVLGLHLEVRESVVIVREDVPGDQRLVAYVVMREEVNPSTVSLRQYLQERLPDYMVPSHFVILEALPLTPHGKVDRRALPVPEAGGVERSHDMDEARTPIEEIVAALWGEVLRLKQVGRDENFFELGGHSLLATQVISRVRSVLQVEVPLRSLFEAPTVAKLAERIERVMRSERGVEIPPLLPASREQELPLSFAQQRLWFLDQLEPGRAAYNIPNAVRLNGELDTAVLEKSIQEIVRRHESLRTTFYMREDQPVQVIAPVVTLRVTLAELSSLSPEKREVEAQRLVQQEAQQSFDLKRGPLLRTMLVRLGGEEHLLLLTMHHIISDGWSMDVLVRELSTLYKAFVLGKPSPLADLPVQYADFAAWQRRWLQGEVLDAQMRYWTERLSDIAPFELPTDHPRPAVHTFHGAAHRILLPASLSEALKRLSQREEVTLFMTLLAAFQALLVRYSGQSDIAVGIPIANRTHAELEDLIGFFVNTLVMRTDLSDNPSFREVLKRVREVCLGAYAHQEVPFEKLVEVLQPERDLSRSPLFQVAFGLQHAPRSPQRMQGLMVSGLAHESGTAKFDLSLAMTDSEQGLHCALEYNTDLFEASTISRFLEHFHTILVGIVAQPEQRLAELPLLSESERQQLLVDWNETQTEYPAGLCLHTLFEAQVERTPEAIALIFEDEHLSYRELNRRANQLAHHLQQLGVKPETFVGVCVERSPALLVSLLAILKVGGAYLPLDPTYPQERLAFLLADAQVSILLTQGHVRTGLPMHKASVICLDSDWQTLVQQCEENPHSPVHVENPAYVIYTSGTTGKPKGVVVTHQGIGNLAQAQGRTFAVRADSHVLQFASFSFDASISEMVMTLLAGATLYFAPQQQLLPGPDLMHLLQEQAITVLTLPPSALTALPVEQALPVLETLIVAGEACSADLVARWAQDRRFFNAYGPTEATVCASMGAYRAEQVKLSIGRPIDNTQVYLLDQYLQPVPRGVPGEIYISGVGLARGYLNRVEVTAECFVPHPFSTVSGARLYKTGDLARYLPGGDIEFLGRVDQQVKVRGYRIELGEIETVLGQHPAVKACAVVVREEVAGDKRLVVYVVARDEEASSGSELRQYLQERLPEYMLPSFFVMVEALPLLPNGKVDRRALPDPNSVAEERSEADVVARSPIEELLAMIWAEVLGRPMHSIYENFFEAGGHSLLATRLIARVRAVMQVELPLQSMFEAPTVAELAQEIEQVMRSEQGVEVPPPLAPVSREQQLPLSFAQQRLWFLDQLDPGNAAYNVPSAVRLSGRLNPQALEQSIQEIGRRHESLRTTFHTREDQPVQVIKANAQFCLSLADLSSLPSARSETEAQRLAQQEAHRPFDLAQGPLLRVRLLRLYEDEHVMLLTMHHIISDGWSMDVFVRELNILYRAFVAGQPSPLPELAIQYADFAAWQRRWLQGPVLDAQLAYWVRQLGGVTPLGLPTDYPRPAVQSYRGASYSFMLPVRLTEALKIVSRQEGVTLFMTLLAAFQTLLARHTGQSDIVVGTDIANRTHVETEALIGFFINLLVLRTDMSGTPTFRELLGRVREMVLTAYAHQDTPFEMLVERLQPEHSLDRMPLVQVLFVLQNIPLSHSDLSGVTLRPFGNGTNTAKFDLAVFLFEGTQGLHGGVTYSTDLFEARTIATMMSRFEVLLHTIAANPDTPIAALEIYTEAEKARQIERLGSTRRKLKTAKGKEIDLP